MIEIRQIEQDGNELNIIRELFRQYEKELDADLCFQSFEKELVDPLQKYGKPSGDLLLAYWDGKPAGCIALTGMDQQGLCEMKRLYVKPAFRKYGIGRALVVELINHAMKNGYQKMRLDTLKKLTSAIRLYEAFGFYLIDPYYHNPLPEVVFMEKNLGVL